MHANTKPVRCPYCGGGDIAANGARENGARKCTKLEAYGNWFLYRWMHVRKHGLKNTVEYLISRICGTRKSRGFDDYGEKDEIWSR